MDPHMTASAAADLVQSGVHRRVLYSASQRAAAQQNSKLAKGKKLVTFAKEKMTRGNSGFGGVKDPKYGEKNCDSLTFVVPQRRSSIPTIPSNTIAYLSADINNPSVSVTTSDAYSMTNSNTKESENLNEKKKNERSNKRDHISLLDNRSSIEEEEGFTDCLESIYEESIYEYPPSPKLPTSPKRSISPKQPRPDCPRHGILARQPQGGNSGLGSPFGSPTRKPSRRGDANGNVMVYDVGARRRNSSPCLWTPGPDFAYNTKPRPFNDEQEEPGQHSIVISLVSEIKQHAKHNEFTGKMTQGQKNKYQEGLKVQNSIDNANIGNNNKPSEHQRERRDSYYEYHKICVEAAQQCHNFKNGRLLESLERGVEFPVIHLSKPVNYILPPSILSKDALGDITVLQQGVYDELVRWYPEMQETRPTHQRGNPNSHIVIGFKTIQGMEVSEDIESKWLEWTGALYIYCNISEELGLSHVTFYRKRGNSQATMFTYLVDAELNHVTQSNRMQLLDFVYRMRIRRGSGYIAVYKECINQHIDDNGNNRNNATNARADKEDNMNDFATIHNLRNINIA